MTSNFSQKWLQSLASAAFVTIILGKAYVVKKKNYLDSHHDEEIDTAVKLVLCWTFVRHSPTE